MAHALPNLVYAIIIPQPCHTIAGRASAEAYHMTEASEFEGPLHVMLDGLCRINVK